MAQRWIHHKTDRVERGDGPPPDGADLHIVDEDGTMAIVNGTLYLNGQPAGEGVYPLRLDGEEFIIVDKHGKAKREKREGQGNGNGSRNPRT